MKKLLFNRERWIPLLGIAAAAFAVACTEEVVDGSDGAETVVQTRAVPNITILCNPEAIGDRETYLALEREYAFSGRGFVPMSPYIIGIICDMSVRNSDGSMDGVEINIKKTLGDLENGNLYVKFTQPGYYHVTAKAEYGGAIYQETKAYCVVSRAKSIVLPDTIRLGEPFDLSFEFFDPAYPAPTIEITESLFNDPKVTVLSNDDRGRLSLRIDQPGKYIISDGLSDVYSACANINLFWRPEKVKCSSDTFSTASGFATNLNTVHLCDSSGQVYNSLPYRVYFEYRTSRIYMIGESYDEITGEKFVAAGNSGNVSMPATAEKPVAVIADWLYNFGYPSDCHWRLTIPDDEKIWVRVEESPELPLPVD